MEKTSPIYIKQEDIPKLEWHDTEVLTSHGAITKREKDIYQATILGYTNQQKVSIIFTAKKGIYRVKCILWAISSKNITLKGGITIPIYCIKEIIID